MKGVLISIVALWGVSTELAGQTPKPDQLLVERGAVLSLATAGPLRACSNAITAPDPTGPWTPDSEQIRSLERALGQTIADNLHAIAMETAKRHLPTPTLPNVSDYYRQYVPIVVMGHRLIFISGFHKFHLTAIAAMDSVQGNATSREDWKHHLVCVIDGGYDFFGAVFDPATGRIERFGFNGVA